MIRGKWVQESPDTYSLYAEDSGARCYGTVKQGHPGLWAIKYFGNFFCLAEHDRLEDAKLTVEKKTGVVTREGLVYQRSLLDKEFAEYDRANVA